MREREKNYKYNINKKNKKNIDNINILFKFDFLRIEEDSIKGLFKGLIIN